jgi:hypothetical protein
VAAGIKKMMTEKPGVVRRVLDAIRNWIADVRSRLTGAVADRAVAVHLRQLERRIGEMMRGALHGYLSKARRKSYRVRDMRRRGFSGLSRNYMRQRFPHGQKMSPRAKGIRRTRILSRITIT